jgi:hypothetical protein
MSAGNGDKYFITQMQLKKDLSLSGICHHIKSKLSSFFVIGDTTDL